MNADETEIYLLNSAKTSLDGEQEFESSERDEAAIMHRNKSMSEAIKFFEDELANSREAASVKRQSFDERSSVLPEEKKCNKPCKLRQNSVSDNSGEIASVNLIALDFRRSSKLTNFYAKRVQSLPVIASSAARPSSGSQKTVNTIASEENLEKKKLNEDRPTLKNKINPGNIPGFNCMRWSRAYTFLQSLGLSKDLEKLSTATESAKSSRRKTYLRACKMEMTIPCHAFLDQVQDNKLNLRHLALRCKDLKPIAITLLTAQNCQHLLLTDNYIGDKGCTHLKELLLNNANITQLDLSENKCIKLHGSKVLGDLLSDPKCTVKFLKLSELGHSPILGLPHAQILVASTNDGLLFVVSFVKGNAFNEDIAIVLSKAMQLNASVTELSLSYNHFGSQGGEAMAELLENNKVLVKLNLSWNHIRLHGGIAISKSLQKSRSLEELDVSWNGFGNEGAFFVGQSLEKNNKLEVLDLTSNRIDMEGVSYIIRGAKNNKKLRALRLSNNVVTTAGACMLLEIALQKTSTIRLIEIKDVTVDEQFDKILPEVLKQRPNFNIVHGGRVRHEDIMARLIAEKDFGNGDPLSLLLEYVKMRNLRLFDMFAQFDKDNSQSVSHDEFKAGIRMAGLPIGENQLQELVYRLDHDNDGEINFGELLQAQTEHRNRQRKKWKTSGMHLYGTEEQRMMARGKNSMLANKPFPMATTPEIPSQGMTRRRSTFKSLAKTIAQFNTNLAFERPTI